MPKHGKKYRRRRPRRSTASSMYDARRRRVKLLKEIAVRQVRRDRSRCTSARASTRATPTSWSAARPSCRAGTGKTQRVLAFAQGDKAREAEAAGADIVGGEELVKRIQGGWTRLRRRRRHAGHDGHGRSPGPGARPARPDAEPALGHRRRRTSAARSARSGGRVEFRVDKTGVIHGPDRQGQLRRRARSCRTWARWSTPSCAPSRRRRRATTSASITLAATMGPGIKLDLVQTHAASRGLAPY